MNKRILFFAVLAVVLVAVVTVNATGNENRVSEKVDKFLETRLKQLDADINDIIADELLNVNKVDKKGLSKDVSSALDIITPELLRKHEFYLASDELEGRGTGYPGNDKATEYVAEQFKKAGLKPIGDNNTYFQNFTVGKLKTRNCVGLLEGSDDRLKDEIIIIGGHHDHVGKKGQKNGGQAGGVIGNDEIWNGADDNASGTSTVMAVAKAFGEGNIRPKRSILFMTFSGEELGLLGSRHYAKNPILPLEKTVAMINLDMVGRNPNVAVGISGISSFSDSDVIKDLLEKEISRTGLKANIQDGISGFWLASDQASFTAKDVPALFFFAGGHKDYHRVTDHPEKIAYNHMALVGKTVFLFINDTANKDKVPSIAADFKKQLGSMARGGGRGGMRLSIHPSYDGLTEDERKELGLKDGEGGLKVETVMEDGVAHKAGMKDGDIIVLLDGKTLDEESPMETLQKFLGSVKKGKDYEILVVRGGERKTLTVRWEEKAQ